MSTSRLARLFIWTERFPPEVGGLEQRMWAIASSISDSGFEVVVVAKTNPGLPDSANDLNIKVCRVDNFLSEGAALLASEVRSIDTLYVARLVDGCERDHAELVQHIESHRTIVRLPSTLAVRQYKTSLPTLDMSHVSFHTLNEYSEVQVARVVQNAKPMRFANPSALGLPSNDYSGPFVFAGRLARPKNLLNLIRAYARSKPSRELHIYGPTWHLDYANTCKSAASAVDGVRYMGVYNQGTARGLAGTFMLTHPSFREGSSNVVAEALSRGIPVVGSRVPGVEEHIRDGGVFIEPPFDPESIADSLRKADRLGRAEYEALSRAAATYHRQQLFVDLEAREVLTTLAASGL